MEFDRRIKTTASYQSQGINLQNCGRLFRYSYWLLRNFTVNFDDQKLTDRPLLRHISTLWMPPMSKANRITGDLLLSPLRLLVSRRKIVECVTAVLLPVRISRISLRNAGQKNSSKKRKTAVALTVNSIDPN